MNTLSSSKQRGEMSLRSTQALSTPFFGELSLAKQWADIESTLAAFARDDGDEAERGWIEGRVHETRSTQKEAELLLVRVHPAQESSTTGEPTRRDDPGALRVFITCPEFALFVFAINQHIKISLKGARVVHELVSPGSAMPPFSLVFSNSMVVQSVRGGVCMPDGTVVDTRQNREYSDERCSLDTAASKLSLNETTALPSDPKRPIVPMPKTPGRNTQSSPYLTPNRREQASAPSLTPVNNRVSDFFDEVTAYPAFSTLTVGIMTPLLGIVESAKAPSTTSNGDLCVSLTLADASSYESGRGFKVTCFTAKSRLARELPTPAEGDAIWLKSVKINKWAGGIIGTVYANKLDWIAYNPATDTISVPRHARSESLDLFYEDVDQRKAHFAQFIEAMDCGPGKKNGRESSKAGM